MKVRHRELLTAIGVDVIDSEALSGLAGYLHTLELKLAQAQDALTDDDRLSDAVGDAFNIVRLLRLNFAEGRGE